MSDLRSSSASIYSNYSDDQSSVDQGYDDDDMMDFTGDDLELKREPNYSILEPKQIWQEQLDHIKNISELYSIPAPSARLLLTQYKWNTDVLLEKLYNDERDKVLKLCGVSETIKPIQKDPKKEAECTICFLDYPTTEMEGLPCGHIFCVDCWKRYLCVKILSEGQSRAIKCPAKGCNLQVDEVTISNLVQEESVLERYRRLVVDAYIEDSPNMRWCPGKDCEYAIKVSLLREKDVTCSCGTRFCFGCAQSPHAPADCKMVKEWLQKSQKEGENSQFLAKFTKECPNCSALIHKEGGCQYMACGKCSHKFCWVCLGAFDHKNHQCNKYKEEVDSKNSARNELHKFMHFFTRYQGHDQSLQAESKVKQNAKHTMDELADRGLPWIDVQFIMGAATELMEARTILKWTYVYGYYLPKAVNRDLFEHLQGELEMDTEKLSGLLEDKNKEKPAIINSTETVKKRIKNLTQGLAEGDITGGGGSEKVYTGKDFEKYEGWMYNAGGD